MIKGWLQKRNAIQNKYYLIKMESMEELELLTYNTTRHAPKLVEA